MEAERERECLKLLETDTQDFVNAAQKYRIEVKGSKTENYDRIMTKLLISLIATGKTDRYLLLRAGMQHLVEEGGLEHVQVLDEFWKAHLLGDIPKIRETIRNLPPESRKQAETAAEKALKGTKCAKKEAEGEEETQQKANHISQTIENARQYFRI